MLCEDEEHGMEKTVSCIKRLATFSLSFGSVDSMAGKSARGLEGDNSLSFCRNRVLIMASCFEHSERTEPERYHYRVSRLGVKHYTTLKPNDIFKFTIRVLSHSTDTNLNSVIPTLLQYQYQSISCQNFFQEGQHFLRTLLSCPHFFIESLDEITDGVVSSVRELFECDADASHSSESQNKEIPLWLVITLFDHDLNAVMEESMMDFRMIPASKEAIRTLLKESKVKKRNECCAICLEQFDVYADGYMMPCNHVFHQQCIVSWLHTSHVCPLCRYPLPTHNN